MFMFLINVSLENLLGSQPTPRSSVSMALIYPSGLGPQQSNTKNRHPSCNPAALPRYGAGSGSPQPQEESPVAL
jgi:hypothetical protein